MLVFVIRDLSEISWGGGGGGGKQGSVTVFWSPSKERAMKKVDNKSHYYKKLSFVIIKGFSNIML